MKIFTALLIIWSLTHSITGRLLNPRVTATSDDDIDIRVMPSAGNPNKIIFERVVVFLYKDILGNVKLYIPNGLKQASIKDLSKDADDILLNVNSEKVKNMFNNNPFATLTVGAHTLVKPQINVKGFAAEVENLLTDDGMQGLCNNDDNGSRPNVENDQKNNKQEDKIIILPEIPKNYDKKVENNEIDEKNESDVKQNDLTKDDKQQTDDVQEVVDSNENGDQIVLPETPIDNSDNNEQGDNEQSDRLLLPEIPSDHDKRPNVDDETDDEGEKIVLPEIPNDHREPNDDVRIILPDKPSKDGNKPDSQVDESKEDAHRPDDNSLPEILETEPQVADSKGEEVKDSDIINIKPAEQEDNDGRLDDDQIDNSNKGNDVIVPPEKPDNEKDIINDNKSDSKREDNEKPQPDENGENHENGNQEGEKRVLPEIPTEDQENSDQDSPDVLESVEDIKDYLPSVPQISDLLYNQILTLREFLELLIRKDNNPDDNNLPDIPCDVCDNENENNILLEPATEFEEANQSEGDSIRENGNSASGKVTIVLPPINANDLNEGESLVLDPIPDSNENNQHDQEPSDIESSKNKPIILDLAEKADVNGFFYLPEVPRHNDPEQKDDESNLAVEPLNTEESEMKPIVLSPIPGDHERDKDDAASIENPSDDQYGNENKPNDADELSHVPNDGDDSENQIIMVEAIQKRKEARARTLHMGVDMLFKNLNLNNAKDFDVWLERETRNITHEKSQEYIIIKEKIIEILARNDLIVNEDKQLVDPNGQIVDPAEIKLRPVFIGPEGAFSRTKDGIKVEVPKGKSFLEAILIIRSQKVLGTIPLGTTPPLEDCGSNVETARIEQISEENANGEIIEAPDSLVKSENIATVEQEDASKVTLNEIQRPDVFRGGDYIDDDDHDDSQELLLKEANKIDNQKVYKNVGNGNVYVNILPPKQAATVKADPIHANTILNLGDPRVNYQILSVKGYENAKVITITPVRAKSKPQPIVLRETNERGNGLHIHRQRDINIKADPRLRRLVNRVPARLAKNYGDEDEYLSNDDVTDRGVPMKKKVGFASEDYYYNRIIGGNTATGSGIPISNKGRLGLIH